MKIIYDFSIDLAIDQAQTRRSKAEVNKCKLVLVPSKDHAAQVTIRSWWFRGKRQTRLPFVSNIRTCLLSNGIAMTLCCCETANLLIGASTQIVVSGDRMFLKSHIFTFRSSAPEITLSLPKNEADITDLKIKII